MGIVTLSMCHLVHSSLPSCKLGVLLSSPLPVVLQDPVGAGGRMSFLVIFNIFLKDESQGEGQEAFPTG